MCTRFIFILWVLILSGAYPAIVFGAEVALEWTPCNVADHYVVSWGTTPGTYSHTSTDIPQPPSGTISLPYTVTGLTEGTTYYFAVQSFNSSGSASSYSDEVSITVGSVTSNAQPEANAGTDLSHPETTNGVPTPITLDGSASTDSDGTISAYHWARVDSISSITTILTSTTASKPSFNAPNVDSNTTLEFELTVTDNEGATATDRVLVTITDVPVNQVPTATPGPSQTVNEGVSVTLNGTDSTDPDGSITTWLWEQVPDSQVPSVTLAGANTATASFTAPDVGGGGTTITFTLTVTDNDGATHSANTIVNVSFVNQPPVAHAGEDQTVIEGASVTLTAESSSDPDNGIASYQWNQLQGTTVTLSSATSIKPTFTAPNVASEGESLQFEVTVTDQDGVNRTDTIFVHVENQNQLPTATPGPTQTVNEGVSVTLNGTGSTDPDGSISTWLWEQVPDSQAPSVTLTGANTSTASFTAPDVGTGGASLSFKLTVTDNDGGTNSANTTVNVSFVNQPPVAHAGPDQTINEGATGTLTAEGSTDPDDGIASYQWIQTQGTTTALSSTTAVKPTFTAPSVPSGGGSLSFQVTVTDQGGLNHTDTVVISIENQNQLPSAHAGSDQTLPETTNGSPTLVTLNGNASSDPDGSITGYSWKRSDNLNDITTILENPDTASPSFDSPDITSDTTLEFKLTVTDNDGATAIDWVEVTLARINQLPVSDAGPNQTVNEQTPVTLSGANSSDPDGTLSSWVWEQVVGSEDPVVTLSGASTKTAIFTSPNVTAGGASLTFKLTVTDNDGGSHSDTTLINVTFDNQPPVAQTGPDKTVPEGTSVTLSAANSTDPDNDPIDTYLWEQLSGPSVALTNAGSPSASFTAPDVDPTGDTLTFRLTVADSWGLSDTDDIIVNVTFDNQPPVADAGPDKTTSEGETVDLSAANSSDPDDGIASYKWSQTEGAPVSLSNAAVINPSFTAPLVSTGGAQLAFLVTVTDEGGLSDSDTVIINVSNQNQAPLAAAGDNQTVSEGELVTLSASASSDPDGSISSYQWVQKAGPAITLSDPSAEAPAFTAPSVDDGGASLTFELKVTDDEGLSATAQVIITVTHTNQPPVARAGSDVSAQEGTTVTLSGADSSDSDDGIASYHWDQTSGPSVTLASPDNAITTFTAPDVTSAGAEVIFRLTASDKGGLSSTDDITVTITYVNRPPVASAGGNQQVNEGASVALSATASQDPDNNLTGYMWEQTGGPAVSISGANTATATFTAPDVATSGVTLFFRLTVTDSEGLTASDTCSIQTLFVNQAPTAHAGADQIVQEGSTVTLDGSASQDPDDGISLWNWTQTSGPLVALTPPGESKAYFVAPKSLPGGVELSFTLTVRDDGGLSHTDTCVVKDTLVLIEPTDDTSNVSVEILNNRMEHLDWLSIGWNSYNKSNNEARVASGDLDGDGNNELVLGLGPVDNDSAIPGGFFQIVSHDYKHLAWGQIPWTEYNDFNGETWPACGDFDGDGRDEIVVGLGKGGQGKLAIFAYSNGHVAHQQWVSVPWETYNDTIGDTRPACGNMDSDTCIEIIVGLGSDPENNLTSNGRYAIFDRACSGDVAIPFEFKDWGQVNWAEYNTSNGATWPTCGNIYGDDRDEIILGMAAGGEGKTEVIQYENGVLKHLYWLTVDWSEYNSQNGETRPSCSDISGDGSTEVIIGLGPVATDEQLPGGRFPALNNDQSITQWGQVGLAPYNQSNGESRPANVKSIGENFLAVGLGSLSTAPNAPAPPGEPEGEAPSTPSVPGEPGGGSSGGCFIDACR